VSGHHLSSRVLPPARSGFVCKIPKLNTKSPLRQSHWKMEKLKYEITIAVQHRSLRRTREGVKISAQLGFATARVPRANGRRVGKLFLSSPACVFDLDRSAPAAGLENTGPPSGQCIAGTTPGYQNNALCPGSLATIMLPPTMRSYQEGGLLVGSHASRLDDGNPPIGFGLEERLESFWGITCG
jgi:hypothetical protein